MCPHDRNAADKFGSYSPNTSPVAVKLTRFELAGYPVKFSGRASTGAVRGALRGGVKAPPVDVARRRRAAAAAVPAAAPFYSAPRFPCHGSVVVRAHVRARAYGVGRRARCRCVAKRATP